jgi:hypothetical protein
MSFELKEKGNLLFKDGDYTGAEEMYSQAWVSLCSLYLPSRRKRKLARVGVVCGAAPQPSLFLN